MSRKKVCKYCGVEVAVTSPESMWFHDDGNGGWYLYCRYLMATPKNVEVSK
jgi:hypothetical protein